MNGLEAAAFVAVVAATLFNCGLQFYTQVETYPLFNWVPDEGFVSFHKEYQRRLPAAIYVPYSLLVLSNVLLLFFRPGAVSLGWVIALLVLNASIMAESLAFAAPVHYRMDRRGYRTEGEVRKLLIFNGFRLLVSAVSSTIVLYLLALVLLS